MRVGVVGLGYAGSQLHLPALARIQQATVVGASDVDPGRRQQVASRWGIPVYDSAAALIRATAPNVVVVATPPETHAACCLEAFAAGAHVLCEKPLAVSVAEADEMIAAARAADCRLAVNHEFREMPIFRAVLDGARAPEVGELVFVQAWQLLHLPPWAESGWRGRMPAGSLYEGGIHLVDYVLALFEEEPEAVSATTSSCDLGPPDSDAVALVTLEFLRGRLAQIVQHRLCPGETRYFEVRADGRRASLRASFGGRARVSAGLLRSAAPHLRVEWGRSGIAWREANGRRTVLARNPSNPAMAATRRLVAKTLAAFRDGTRPPASGEDGRAALRVLAAAYHSAAVGQRVELGKTAALSTLRLPDAAGRQPGSRYSGPA